MRKTVSNFQLLALDTNVFVYYLDRNSPFYRDAEKLFQIINDKNLSMVTSILTLTELLSFKAPERMIKILEDEFSSIPNLSLREVNQEVAQEAARIRRKYGLKIVDSIQVATALIGRAQAFITNDDHLKSFKELKILSLSQVG